MTAAKIKKLNRIIEDIETLQRGLDLNTRQNDLLRSAKVDLILARNLAQSGSCRPAA